MPHDQITPLDPHGTDDSRDGVHVSTHGDQR